MLTLFLMISILLSPNTAETLLTLEYPALGFEYLAPEFVSPIEGELTEESGVLVSPANSTGTEYKLYYWQGGLAPNTRSEDVLYGKLVSVMSPDNLDDLIYGDADWMEGSINATNRNTASIGLVSSLNFNIVTDAGIVRGAGKAYIIFNNNYTILFYCIAPVDSGDEAKQGLDEMIAGMYSTG